MRIDDFDPVALYPDLGVGLWCRGPLPPDGWGHRGRRIS